MKNRILLQQESDFLNNSTFWKELVENKVLKL